MTIDWQTTQVDGKPMRIYLGLPDAPGTHPGVVIAHHGPGLNGPTLDMVHRLVREGYAAAAPDLFHRQDACLGMMERIELLRDAEIIEDLRGTAAHLRSLGGAVGPLGIMGFCMGGRVAYLGAAAVPEFRAAAVFYGGSIMQPWGGGPTPFERSAAIACPVIGFFGVQDTNPSPGDVGKIDAELTRLGKWHEFHSYNDAGHAFHNFTSEDRYRERAARGSWGELVGFFNHFLKR